MSDSDIEMKKIAPMKPVKKPPRSPTEDILKTHERKVTTKAMIHEALIQLKTRKGVSSQAIKKYMEDKYNVETEKVKYLIKKTLKTGVEDGSIIQLKGIGASGSFKLAPVKEKPKKPKPAKEKLKKEKPTKEKSKEKPIKEKMKIVKEKATKTDKTKPEKKAKIVKDKEKVKKTEKPKAKKGMDEVKVKERVKPKMAATPKKKALMQKRKSIGSIIKKPKMKPKYKA